MSGLNLFDRETTSYIFITISSDRVYKMRITSISLEFRLDSEATVTAEAGGDEQEITSPPMKEVYLSVKKAPKVSAGESS